MTAPSGAPSEASHIGSRDNALVKELRDLARHNAAYRERGRCWVEGEHLCQAAIARGLVPEVAVFAESAWPTPHAAWVARARRSVVLADKLFEEVSALPSAARMGFVLPLPAGTAPHTEEPSIVLDRVQDAGNVGSILRSAAAFGFRQVLALKGSAALWSPKVLRAGMGAHFGLHLVEGLDAGGVQRLQAPSLVTSSHQGALLHEAALPWPCNWVFGHEGQGVDARLLGGALQAVRIAQPGGEESLNVAAAAAICLHASATQRRQG